MMADALSRSNQTQSTEWSLHSQVFKQICPTSFAPHIDLFATNLNHKIALCISSPRPTFLGHGCSEHKLVGSHCLCFPSHGSPSQGDPKNTAILLILIARGRPGMPWFWDLVQLSTEIPLRLPVPTTLLK